jgi:hypothetical protein
MFKKGYYFIFVIIILSLVPSTSGYFLKESNEIISVNIDKTFLIGTLLNPIESGMIVNASAISLVYYNHSALTKNIGLVQGLKKVSFEKQPFFYLYKPGPLGLIAYVFGYCINFKIE